MMSFISILVGIVFVGILLLTYFTDIGARGIKHYWSDFKLFDMQFHYDYRDINNSLTNLNFLGREAYKKYLVIDYVFIMCLLFLMIRGGYSIAKGNNLLNTCLIILAVLRAVFDVIENTVLIYLINEYPKANEFIAIICSYATTLKFICLFIWIAIILIVFTFQKIA